MSGPVLGGYYEDYWSRTKPPTLGDRYAATRLELLSRCLRDNGPGTRVLDAGTGLGELVAALAATGMDATGMDVSARAVTGASRRYPGRQFVAHDAESLPWPFEQDSFDVVVAFEVIEHLLRPRRLLEGARDVLRPGGDLVLTTPHHGVLKNLALVLLAFDKHFAVEGDHIRFFSDRALRELLESSGFTVERLEHYGRLPGLAAGTFVWARKR